MHGRHGEGKQEQEEKMKRDEEEQKVKVETQGEQKNILAMLNKITPLGNGMNSFPIGLR